MGMRSASIIALGVFCQLLFVANSQQQQAITVDVHWCAAGFAQHRLCESLENQLYQDTTLTFGSYRGRIRFTVKSGSPTYMAKLTCVNVHHIFECAEKLMTGEVDVARFTAEELYGLAKNQNNRELVAAAAPVSKDGCGSSSNDCHEFAKEYSVAVVKRNSNIRQLANLKDSNACFGPTGDPTTWTIPVSKILSNWTTNPDMYRPIQTKSDTLKPIQMKPETLKPIPAKSENYDKTRMRQKRLYESSKQNQDSCATDLTVANDVFVKSCAPGLWATENYFAQKYSDRLCAGCAGKNESCTMKVKLNDAASCLGSGKGDVGFMTNAQAAALFPPFEYTLLCGLGTRELDEFRACHWGVLPQDVFVANGGMRKQQDLPPYAVGAYVTKLFSTARDNLYSRNVTAFIADPKLNSVVSRLDLKMNMPMKSPSLEMYLKHPKVGGDEFWNAMEYSFPACRQNDDMRLCVISPAELVKCKGMEASFRAAGLPESLKCVIGYSEENCLKMLNNSQADVAMVAAHTAEKHVYQEKVRPILDESYGSEAESVYALAVTLSGTRMQSLQDLAHTGHLRVCSAGTDSFTGWEAPNKVMKDLGIISQSNCYLTEFWSSNFGPSCVPGAQNASVTLGRDDRPIDKQAVASLCLGCGNMPMEARCKTPAEATDAEKNEYSLFYGDIGALKCLMKRSGDVAFIRSSAIKTALYMRQLGDAVFRSAEESTFSLLCGDGKRRLVYSPENVATCNLGRMPDRWMVSRNADAKQLLRWQDLWLFGFNRARKSYDWLKTYVHVNPNIKEHLLDLIFTNSTTALKRFPVYDYSVEGTHDSTYKDWKSPFDCSAATRNTNTGAILLTSLFSAIIVILLR